MRFMVIVAGVPGRFDGPDERDKDAYRHRHIGF